MRAIIIDTNVFLRFLLNDIPKQKIIVEKLFRWAKNGEIELLVVQIVIFEIDFILRKYYQFPKVEVVDKLESILVAPYFSIQDGNIFRKSLNDYKEKNLSLVDCFLIAKAEIEEVKIFTFDKDLNKLITK